MEEIPRPKVSIILLNWNGLEDTIECIESLKKITYPNYEVIVVDNGSKGNDAGILQEKYQDYIKVMRNKENLGFAEGNNVGMRQVLKEGESEYILLLNNDTIVDPKFLTELVRVAQTNPKIGIVGGKIYYYYDPRRIWYAGGKWGKFRMSYHINMNKLDKNNVNDRDTETDWVMGCLLLVKTSIIKEVGLLPEDYFLYVEETDFCLRVQRYGYKIYYVPEAKIWHKCTASFNKEKSTVAIPHYYGARNQLYFAKTYLPFHKKMAFYLFFFSYRLLRFIQWFLQGRWNFIVFACLGIEDFLRGRRGKREL